VSLEALQSATVRVRDDVTSRILDGEAVILALSSGTYFGLDQSGTRIWELIAERSRVEDILDAMVHEYDVDRGRCEQDLTAFLSELCSNGLIDIAPPQPAPAP
jgi:Coenzyme PQQ synthesis protein D (PqqD)